MAVGTDCCDKLTGTTDASEYHDMMLKDRGKVKRFVSSSRWKTLPTGEESIIRAGIAVRISEAEGRFYIGLGQAHGRASHDSLIDAKIKALQLIDSGDAANYLEKRRHRELARLRHRDAKKAEARLRAIERP